MRRKQKKLRSVHEIYNLIYQLIDGFHGTGIPADHKCQLVFNNGAYIYIGYDPERKQYYRQEGINKIFYEDKSRFEKYLLQKKGDIKCIMF